jgi:threonine/homoserine/homoserine lactone efflux protein
LIADLLPFLLQGSALGISAAFSPGPFQSLVIAKSLVGSFRRDAPVVFAPLIADLPIAGVLVFAVNQIPAGFLDGVRIAGAGLLLYLAWGSFKTMQAAPPAGDPPVSSGTTIRRGLIKAKMMLFLSPGPYLYWSLVTGPILVRALD